MAVFENNTNREGLYGETIHFKVLRVFIYLFACLFLFIYLFIYLFISFDHTKYIQRYDKQIVKQTKQGGQENQHSVSQ